MDTRTEYCSFCKRSLDWKGHNVQQILSPTLHRPTLSNVMSTNLQSTNKVEREFSSSASSRLCISTPITTKHELTIFTNCNRWTIGWENPRSDPTTKIFRGVRNWKCHVTLIISLSPLPPPHEFQPHIASACSKQCHVHRRPIHQQRRKRLFFSDLFHSIHIHSNYYEAWIDNLHDLQLTIGW